MQVLSFKNILLIFALSIPFCTKLSVAGSGLVVVQDGKGKLCEEGGPEYPILHLTSEEAVNSLTAWLLESPQPKFAEKSKQKSAAEPTMYLPGAEIAFTGYIKFCGIEERRRYFATLTDHLKDVQKNERAFVLVLLHSRSDVLLDMVQKAIEKAEHSSLFKEHLEKAIRLIEFQRKSPEPYPTEKVVRRIEKKLLPAKTLD